MRSVRAAAAALLLFLSAARLLAAAPIEGKVVDEFARPVAGARVILKGGTPTPEATTGNDGRFQIEAPSVDSVTLVFEAAGFATLERRVRAADRSRPLAVALVSASFADAVTVTAARAPTRLGDTAASVVQLTGDDLDASAAPATDVALRDVPGFTLFRRTDSRAANPTAQGVSLRGVGGSGASRAAVLDDGIPLNDPFGGWIEWGRVPREAIDRIEVLRGGASDLYGGSALAGAIALFRRDPGFPEARVEAALGSEHEQDASVFLSDSRGPWTARLAGDFFDTDGYIAVAPSNRGPIDVPVASRHEVGDLTLERGEPGQARIFLRGNYFDETRENGTPLQTNDTRMWQLAAGADVPDFAEGDLTLRVYGISEKYHQVFSSVAADRRSERLTDLQAVPSESAGLLTQWQRSIGSHRLVAGLEAAQVRGSSDEILGSTGATFSNAGGRQRTGALFVDDSITLGSRWIVSAGARFDLWQNFDGALTKGAAGTPGTVTSFANRSENAVSPRGTALFRITSELSATASAYRSFRAPTLNELYRSFQLGNTLTLANPALAAEHLTGAEVGMIWKPAGGRVLARGTLFSASIDNTITSITLSSTPSAITMERSNLGRTRSRGIELDVEAILTGDLAVSAGYLFADSTVVSASDATLEGRAVPQVPRQQGSVRIRDRWGPVLISAEGRWIGNQFEDAQNLLPLGSAAIASAAVSTEIFRGIEAFAACENIFNAEYSVARTPIRSLGQPRAVRFGLRAAVD